MSQQQQHKLVVGNSAIEPRHGVLTPGPIAVLPLEAPHIQEAVRAAGGQLQPLGPDTKGLVWLTLDAKAFDEVMQSNPQIEWVQLPWAGVDRFAKSLARYKDQYNVTFTSAKGAYAEPVAEHAVALALGGLRFFCKRARATRWEDTELGDSLYGRNVLVIGPGGIGTECIRLLQPFRVNITVVRKRAGAVPGTVRCVTFDRFHEVLPDADVVIIAAPLTPETTKMFGLAEFKLMKRTAYIVNVGRGPIIDTEALVDALKCNEILGAGLDVTDPEPLPEGHYLWTDQRVLITPHSADTEAMCAPLLAERTKQNVEAFINGTPFHGLVDLDLGY